jgi:hypothetical protein
MTDQQDEVRDLSRETNPVVPEVESGTTAEEDFGKTDRYANTDQGKDFNFRSMGDGSAWDTGREAAGRGGTRSDADPQAADTGTPGVRTVPADRPD